MFRTVTLVILLAGVVYGGWTTQSVNLRFELTVSGIGSEAFIEMPISEEDATSKSWIEYTRPTIPTGYSSLVMLCPSGDDLTICMMYDDTGFIAGMQIAFDQDFISDPSYDWEIQGYSNWTVTLTNGTSKQYWTHQQYYASADFLATDSATRIAARDDTTILQDENIWVTGFNGALYNISTNVTDFTESESDYTEQACIVWMGRHYYYKMTTTTECSDTTIFPWFPLVYSGQLVGVGHMLFAKNNAENSWYEAPTQSNVEMIVPYGPECMYDLADSPGVITLHTYFVSPAYTITCVFE